MQMRYVRLRKSCDSSRKDPQILADSAEVPVEGTAVCFDYTVFVSLLFIINRVEDHCPLVL